MINMCKCVANAIFYSGAVDMDVYGAFQCAAIGVLAMPFTIGSNSKYKLIVLCWTSLMLSGESLGGLLCNITDLSGRVGEYYG